MGHAASARPAFTEHSLGVTSTRRGIELRLIPRSDLQLGISHRAFWLASDTDVWTTTGTLTTALRDRTGKTSTYIGQQMEVTARWPGYRLFLCAKYATFLINRVYHANNTVETLIPLMPATGF